MKVALCLSGHLRTFDKVFSSLEEKVIKPFNCDVFIHTWNTLGSLAGCDGKIRGELTSNYLPQIIRLFDPKSIDIENYDDSIFLSTSNQLTYPSNKIIGNVNSFCGMFYSIKKSNELRKKFEIDNNVKYDYIIRCRPDLFFSTHLDNSYFPSPGELFTGFQPTHYVNVKCNFNTLDSLHFNKSTNIESKSGSGINDQFAIGDNTSINIYSDTYDIIGECNGFPELRPELILRYQIDKHNINFMQKPIYYAMIRSDEYASILSNEKYDPPLNLPLPLMPSSFPLVSSKRPIVSIPTSSIINPRLPQPNKQTQIKYKGRNNIVKSTAFPSPIYKKIK